MAHYQVLFSGDLAGGANEISVRQNLARELKIDERKAAQLFSGRTVVIRSQMSHEEAIVLQNRFAELGAVCRIKDLTPRAAEPQIDFRVDREERDNEQTLRDITAAHVECPRCGHLQLEASHCARCGIDIGAAIRARQKEDLIIQKKIREMRYGKEPASTKNVKQIHFETAQAEDEGSDKKRGMMSWFRKTS